MIPSSSLCPSSLNLSNSDILTIYDGDEVVPHVLGQYFGNSSPQKLYSSTPDLTIQFHSDPAGLIFGKGQGFIMNYIGRYFNPSILFVLEGHCAWWFPVGLSVWMLCDWWTCYCTSIVVACGFKSMGSLVMRTKVYILALYGGLCDLV